ncbi:hypothetical protein D9758_015124 [Tetrapyrgos nigripes]|uniref:Uncharacterized protein n=1 Tax=Tetrapyrgos nigripes TaxID=182062 RepID=A0A8H5FDF4_9AGAR|nr:hypothetical protein D9758_015124 [Tetrapyrgos nigripes]
MQRILSVESDRRTVNITINSFNIELSKEQRAKLFPAIGRLFPEGNNQLAKADELDQVRAEYRSFFPDSPSSGAANGTGGDGDESSAVSQLEDRSSYQNRGSGAGFYTNLRHADSSFL